MYAILTNKELLIRHLISLTHFVYGGLAAELEFKWVKDLVRGFSFLGDKELNLFSFNLESFLFDPVLKLLVTVLHHNLELLLDPAVVWLLVELQSLGVVEDIDHLEGQALAELLGGDF